MGVPCLLLFHQVDAHEVLVGAAEAARDGAERRGGDDQQGDEGQHAVEDQRHGGVDGCQGRRGEEAQHAARLAEAVEAVCDSGLAADDVGQAGAGEGHDQEADAYPVVAAAVRWLPEKPEGADKEHERQQQGHPAEGAVDHRVDGVREPPGQAPPGEGGDEDAQGEVEQGGAVAAFLGGEVADVVADPPDSAAHHVPDPQPGAANHPHQPRLVVFDGGELAGARGAGRAAARRSCLLVSRFRGLWSCRICCRSCPCRSLWARK